MLNFEAYLDDFNSTISIGEFFLNLLVVVFVAYLIKIFYIRYGRAISDRRKFSNNFIPLALGTMLIITVVQSSIALSLGLVGALSIVRFRAAIKDPEELTFLFLIIGLGLMGGANKPLLALFSFMLVIPVLYFNSRISTKEEFKHGNSYLNLVLTNGTVTQITDTIKPHTTSLDLKRYDVNDNGLAINYFCQLESPKELEKIKQALQEIDKNAKISFVDQPNILL